jgi:hypothetical protein
MSIGDVTRITSANLHVEFKPALYPNIRAGTYAGYSADTNHVAVVDINGSTTGTFKLVVNGYKTAALTASGTLAATDVQTALEALENVGAGGITVTGDAGGPFTLTAAADLLNAFLVIEVADDATDEGVTVEVTSQGSSWYTLSSEASSFSHSGTQETTDVTGISEKSRRHASTVSDANFELSIYEALQAYRHFLIEGVQGYLRVFEDGKAAGRRYFAWEVMLTDVSENFEAFEKVEIEISGRRQGDAIARIGSIWS